MKKILLSLSAITVLTISAIASENSAKGLNVLITSEDTQTQMMGMVLSTMTLKQGKEVNMTLCSSAGNLAIKGSEAKTIKMQGEEKSPNMLLQGLIKQGAKVEVCPLFLPNSGKTEADLIEGVSVAKPAEVAAKILDKEYQTLSY
ncbi:DsrE family protein [Arcobacter vandammei]|uniref:DsrE family protein n=1 Tax=Arcobacter vandammei TaxID=2782243 RepID=UPI0018DF2979|nr:DsrE family protein [Arcobacter vandammei]